MNEAPKKLWVGKDWKAHPRAPLITKKCTPYIRGDLVDEMVKVLEQCLKVNGYQNAREMIEAVLEKVKPLDSESNFM